MFHFYVIVCNYGIVLLTAPGWWDKEVHKISFKIVSELIVFSSEVEDTQKNYVRRALFGLDDKIMLSEKTKIFDLRKVDKYFKLVII